MERYEVYKTIENFETSIHDLERAIDLEKLDNRLFKLNEQMKVPSFWHDPNQAKLVTQEANQLQTRKDTILSLKAQFEDIKAWADTASEGTEEWIILEEEIADLTNKLDAFQVEILLNDPYDDRNAILELHPGAGGTESMDWCGMLMRMYQRYAQLKGFKVEILNYLAGDEAGVKSVTMRIAGPYAYGYLKAERGVHRLVRISPFDSNKRR